MWCADLFGTTGRSRCEACHRVNKSATKTLTEAVRLAVRKRYRTILTQGGKELPEIPPRPKGKRGRIAKSDAHNLHERLAKHEESVLRFMGDPDVSFTNNTGRAENQEGQGQDQGLRMFPNPALRRSLVPDLKLPEFHGSARLQPSRRHTDRTRRKRRRNDKDALRSTQTQKGVSSYHSTSENHPIPERLRLAPA